jgi:hypothetical protein
MSLLSQHPPMLHRKLPLLGLLRRSCSRLPPLAPACIQHLCVYAETLSQHHNTDSAHLPGNPAKSAFVRVGDTRTMTVMLAVPTHQQQPGQRPLRQHWLALLRLSLLSTPPAVPAVITRNKQSLQKAMLSDCRYCADLLLQCRPAACLADQLTDRQRAEGCQIAQLYRCHADPPPRRPCRAYTYRRWH